MININQVKAQLTLDKWKSIGSEGRNSKVFTARDKQLDQVLVVKEINKTSLKNQSVESYFAEAKILNESKHPHIMPVYYSAEDKSNVYLTMPYYQNGSLNTVMNRRFFTSREIIKYSLDFLSGLLFIHIKKLLHLDIKPTNVIIDDTDRAILTDFGLSRYLDEQGFAEQTTQYNPHRAPEAYNTIERTVLDDIYQAGLTMYRMCNGNTSFKKQFDELISKHNNNREKIVESIQKGIFPNRKKYLPHIPDQLKKVINTMLNVNTNKRYQDVLTIINDLSKINSTLDWQYEVDDNLKKCIWRLENENSIITVNSKHVGEKYLTNAEKLTKISGNKQKQHKFTGEHNSIDQAFKFLKSQLIQ